MCGISKFSVRSNYLERYRMPVRKIGNKWKIGSGKAMYKTKAAADRAYKAYLAKKHSKGKKK